LQLKARAREAATGQVAERRYYAKIFRDEVQGEQAHQALRALWDRASWGEAGFTVARPVAYLDSLRLLIQEEVPGSTLTDRLCREEEVLPATRKAARALAALHLVDVTPPHCYRLQEEFAHLERSGELLRSVCPHLGPEIEEIVRVIVAALAEIPPAPTHCDFKADHVLLDGDRVALLDVDKLAGGDPVRDVANFMANLLRQSPHYRLPDERRWAVEQAFVEEYFVHVPEAWRARLPYRHAMALLNKAASLDRRQEPGWSNRIEAFLRETRASLAGRGGSDG
jgi:Ser/Thr protein kinase RdoA (MazF antagonist)